MNKTTNIHLAQTLFSLDENAYALLKNYLDKLERLFQNTEGAKDILEDIEARIAELFTALKKDNLYVISVEDVEKVIETLGTPEDLASEDTTESTPQYDSPKKLFRDPDDRFLSGVAGGLSHYLGLDSVWIRLILLILFFSSVGGVVLVYILLWVLIPEAKTTAEKLMMKGEPVNVSTIKNKIKEEIEQVSDKVKDVDYKNMGDQLKKKSKDFSDILLKLVKGIVKLLSLLIGVFFLFVSSMVLLFLFVGSIIGSVFTAVIPNEIMQYGLSLDIPIVVLGFFSLLIIGIPFVFLFSLGLQLLARNKSFMSRFSKLILLGVWIISLITLMVFGIIETKSFAISAKSTQDIHWEQQTQDTLKIYLNDDHSYNETVTVFNQVTLIENEAGEKFRIDDNIRLWIGENKDNTLHMTIEKEAKGWSQSKAKKNTEVIDYSLDYYDNQLVLDNFWLSPINHKSHPESVRLKLTVPEGKYLYIDNDLAPYLSHKINNDQDFYRKRIAGHLWKMQQGKLQCQDCKKVNGNMQFDEDSLEINLSDDTTTIKVNIDEDGLEIEKKEY
ncbi:MAG: PspC domain-containing protein [Flavobacteriaceae bacterium]